MKKYTIPSIYRGEQIFKIVWAMNDSQASKLLDVSVYQIKNYGFKNTDGDKFDGIMGYFDGGILWEKHKDLIRKSMPLDELTKLIDQYKDQQWNDFKKNLGIDF